VNGRIVCSSLVVETGGEKSGIVLSYPMARAFLNSTSTSHQTLLGASILHNCVGAIQHGNTTTWEPPARNGYNGHLEDVWCVVQKDAVETRGNAQSSVLSVITTPKERIATFSLMAFRAVLVARGAHGTSIRTNRLFIPAHLYFGCWIPQFIPPYCSHSCR